MAATIEQSRDIKPHITPTGLVYPKARAALPAPLPPPPSSMLPVASHTPSAQQIPSQQNTANQSGTDSALDPVPPRSPLSFIPAPSARSIEPLAISAVPLVAYDTGPSTFATQSTPDSTFATPNAPRYIDAGASANTPGERSAKRQRTRYPKPDVACRLCGRTLRYIRAHYGKEHPEHLRADGSLSEEDVRFYAMAAPAQEGREAPLAVRLGTPVPARGQGWSVHDASGEEGEVRRVSMTPRRTFGGVPAGRFCAKCGLVVEDFETHRRIVHDINDGEVVGRSQQPEDMAPSAAAMLIAYSADSRHEQSTMGVPVIPTAYSRDAAGASSLPLSSVHDAHIQLDDAAAERASQPSVRQIENTAPIGVSIFAAHSTSMQDSQRGRSPAARPDHTIPLQELAQHALEAQATPAYPASPAAHPADSESQINGYIKAETSAHARETSIATNDNSDSKDVSMTEEPYEKLMRVIRTTVELTPTQRSGLIFDLLQRQIGLLPSSSVPVIDLSTPERQQHQQQPPRSVSVSVSGSPSSVSRQARVLGTPEVASVELRQGILPSGQVLQLRGNVAGAMESPRRGVLVRRDSHVYD